MTDTPRPRFTGARLYNDPDRLFSFWYPHTWHQMQPEGQRNTVLVAPQADHLATSFSVEVRDLGMPVTQEDLPLLREAVEEGLVQLGDYQMEAFGTFDEPGRFGFELRYTFRFEDTWRKRRALLYYRDHYQYSLIAQGATIEDFDTWQPMFSYMMLTCNAGGFDLRAWAEGQQRNSGED
ncbi:MAG: hypothetical protein K8J31_24490 [Anaerolineae bacterium]|nr:hypothetical protein [Anaerolineae bacterium]